MDHTKHFMQTSMEALETLAAVALEDSLGKTRAVQEKMRLFLIAVHISLPSLLMDVKPLVVHMDLRAEQEVTERPERPVKPLDPLEAAVAAVAVLVNLLHQ